MRSKYEVEKRKKHIFFTAILRLDRNKKSDKL